MTPNEVLLAVKWSSDEASRLDREAKPFREIAQAIEDGSLDPDSLSDETLIACAEAAECAADASQKVSRLMKGSRHEGASGVRKVKEA